MEYWNHIYENFNPVAFSLFGLKVHWYGMMYVLALLFALYVAKWLVKKDKIDMQGAVLDDFFIWVEVGVILGARLGYILFYDPNTLEYLSHPWNIFNPFVNGEFVGIRGMSYHGALMGFMLGAYLYARKVGVNFWFLMDRVGIAVPIGYFFGRVGNFLNQELVGRETTLADTPWGIYVDGVLRHPSQLYEAFLEGILIFVVLYLFRKKMTFTGSIALTYGAMYGLGRFIAEFWRAPDVQIGYVLGTDWLTQGQVMSLSMAILAVLWLLTLYILDKKNITYFSCAK